MISYKNLIEWTPNQPKPSISVECRCGKIIDLELAKRSVDFLREPLFSMGKIDSYISMGKREEFILEGFCEGCRVIFKNSLEVEHTT